MTQRGISHTIGESRAFVTKEPNRLKEKDCFECEPKHVARRKRQMQVY